MIHLLELLVCIGLIGVVAINYAGYIVVHIYLCTLVSTLSQLADKVLSIVLRYMACQYYAISLADGWSGIGLDNLSRFCWLDSIENSLGSLISSWFLNIFALVVDGTGVAILRCHHAKQQLIVERVDGALHQLGLASRHGYKEYCQQYSCYGNGIAYP